MTDCFNRRHTKLVHEFSWPQHAKICEGHNIPDGGDKLHCCIPNLCHGGFWQLGTNLRHQEKKEMPQVAPVRDPTLVWRVCLFHSGGSTVLGKPVSSYWRDNNIASNFCIPLFHVDRNQEARSDKHNVAHQLGGWLFRYSVECGSSCCSSQDFSGARPGC